MDLIHMLSNIRGGGNYEKTRNVDHVFQAVLAHLEGNRTESPKDRIAQGHNHIITQTKWAIMS